MTEEIKEILSIVSEGQDSIQRQQLVNYITNLQKENENLKQQLDFIDEQNKYIDKIENKIKDYKQRNEKAIKYIRDSGLTFLNLANQRCFCNNNCADKILNILEGGDE